MMTNPIQQKSTSTGLMSVEVKRREGKCLDAVCRVMRSDDDYGTGFVIARRLIMTNNHVFPDKETCRGQKAQFFLEEGSRAIEVELDPDAFFVTSPTPGNEEPLTEKKLDFTIIALKECEDKAIRKIYKAPLSIFQAIFQPSEREEAFIIQHPKGEKSSPPYKQIPKEKTCLLEIGELTIHYNTSTKGGSSGGPVLDSLRRLYGLHRVGGCLEHSECNQGVLIKAIVAFLEKEIDPKSKQTYANVIKNWDPKISTSNGKKNITLQEKNLNEGEERNFIHKSLQEIDLSEEAKTLKAHLKDPLAQYLALAYMKQNEIKTIDDYIALLTQTLKSDVKKVPEKTLLNAVFDLN